MYKKIALLFVVFLFSTVSSSAEIDTSKLEQQCNNITDQQRQLARSAGYDVEELCDSLKTMSSDAKLSQPKTVMPRDGIVRDNNANGQVRGQGQGEGSKVFKDVAETFEEGADNASLEEDKEDQSVDKEELKQYGYDLFAGVPTTFAPATDIPIPLDYVLGPGDNIVVQLFGKISSQFELVIQRDGKVNFPDLGPISLAGLPFSEMKEMLTNRIKEQMIGVNISLSMGELRSIQVFVLGDAYRPGSYTVSSLSTMTNALFASGGITNVGSLRDIQLKRSGKLVTRIDLYDLLLKGDTSGDMRLQPGDVLFVPPIGKVASIAGEVKRPAIYELKNEKNVGQLLELAGGLLPNAFPDMAIVERISQMGDKTVVNLDLSSAQGKSQKVRNGDLVKVLSVLDRMQNIVLLSGHIHRPGAFQWTKGMRVTNLVKSMDHLLPNPDVDYALIKRERRPLRELEVHQVSLRRAMQNPGGPDDLLLHSRDEVIVFGKGQMRAELTADIIEKLKGQSSGYSLSKIVTVRGDVYFPGEYPLTPGMSAKQLIEAAGGLREAAYMNSVEITRQDLSDPEKASVKIINIDLASELSNKSQFELMPKDKLAIFTTPNYREDHVVTLQGEVLFPGIYEFKRGETLSQVIARAGGFTAMAHTDAAIFTREDLRLQEAQQLEQLQERMRGDLAASELEEAAAGEKASFADAEGLLEALSETKALGRLVISLEDIVSAQVDDIQLKNGDTLIVPTFRQEVSVLGEVQHASSHIYNQQWTLEDYLENAGGLTNRADDDRIYVVKADGSVFLPNQSGWLTHQNEMLSPGDTIVVPLDTDRIKSLTLWTNVSQIVYQLALGAAAVRSL